MRCFRAVLLAVVVSLAFAAASQAAPWTPSWRAPVSLGGDAAQLGDVVTGGYAVVIGWQGSDGSVNVTEWAAQDPAATPVVTRLADHGSVPHLVFRQSDSRITAWWTEDGPAPGQHTLQWSHGPGTWSAPETVGPPSSEPFQVLRDGDAALAVVEPAPGDRELDLTLDGDPPHRLSTGPVDGTPAVATDPASGSLHVVWRQQRAGATDVLGSVVGYTARAAELLDRVPDDLAGDPVAATIGMGVAWPSTRDGDGHQQIALVLYGGTQQFSFSSPGQDVAAIHQVSAWAGEASVAWSTVDPGIVPARHMMIAMRNDLLSPFSPTDVLTLDEPLAPVTAGGLMRVAWAQQQADAPLNVMFHVGGDPGWALDALPGPGTLDSLRFGGQDSYDAAFDRAQDASTHRLFLTVVGPGTFDLATPIDLSGPVASVQYDIRDVATRQSAETQYWHPLVAWQAAGGPLEGSYTAVDGSAVTATISDEPARQITVTGPYYLGGAAVWLNGSTVRGSFFHEPPAAPAPDPTPDPVPVPDPAPAPVPDPAPASPQLPAPATQTVRPKAPAAARPALSVRLASRGRVRVSLRCPATASAGCAAKVRWTARLPHKPGATVLARTPLWTVARGTTLTRTLKPAHTGARARNVRTTVEALTAAGASIAARRVTVARLA